MIVGLGNDIVSNVRIKTVIQKFGDRFLKKYFSVKELAKYEKYLTNIDRYSSGISNLFAAKEAFVKALGVGFRFGFSFKDIEVLNDDLGKPYISLYGKVDNYVKKHFKTFNKLEYYLSISDDGGFSFAVVVIEAI